MKKQHTPSVDEKPAPSFPAVPITPTDLHVDRQREIDKELREDEMWRDQD